MDYSGNTLLKSTIEFLSGYEFRVPIHGIIGVSEFLQNADTNLGDEERRAFAKEISLGAKRLETISERLSVWHKLFSQTTPVVSDVFQFSSEKLGALAKKEAEAVSFPVESLQLSLSANGIAVRGNEARCCIAIEELLRNAFRFSMAGTPVSVTAVSAGETLVIEITNVSDAVTVEELKQYTAFTRFHHKKQEQPGLGLGLEIARLAVAQCGGSLSVHQREGTNDAEEVMFRVVLSCAAGNMNPDKETAKKTRKSNHG